MINNYIIRQVVKMIKKNKEKRAIVLYGAGTQNLRMVYQPLVSSGNTVEYICDADEHKQGKKFENVKIISPLELEQLAEKQLLEIIITVRTEQVVRKIKSWLGHLPNSIIYTFNEFIEEWKPNCNLRRFSCVMFHLTDHCNLSCVRCSHFSPLAKSSFFIDVHLFERDCCRLAELTGGDVDEIQLSGGEPLLHPEVEKFPYIVRKYFPKTKIIIITNATRLKFMKNSFFQACVENKVEVWISQYPINLPYEEIEKMLDSKGINVTYGNSGNTLDKPKQMWGVPLKIQGGLNGQQNFEDCLCMQYILRDGRMYPCANSAYIDLFNEYFDKRLPGPTCNGVDIFGVKTLEELTQELSKSIPLCEYCDAKHRMDGIPWKISEKKICEWALDER